MLNSSGGPGSKASSPTVKIAWERVLTTTVGAVAAVCGS
ncbi:hypothetical protein N602_16515 [Mycobacterium avium subsp. hominissuis 10-5606]|nr:hypothetical protein N602_16515 [Mycobacterium avium subsp. hominissuis 10-5606]